MPPDKSDRNPVPFLDHAEIGHSLPHRWRSLRYSGCCFNSSCRAVIVTVNRHTVEKSAHQRGKGFMLQQEGIMTVGRLDQVVFGRLAQFLSGR